MYSKIIQKRWLGIKRPDRDIANDPGVFGQVTMFYAGQGHTCLQAQRHGCTNETGKLLAPLWDAQCVAKGGDSEVWRGYQRAKLPHGLGYTTCVQEWYIEHLAMHPPVDGENIRRWPGPTWGELPSAAAPGVEVKKESQPEKA